MINGLNWFLECRTRIGWLFLMLFAISACQPAQSTSIPQSSPTQIPTILPTSTEPVAFASPTLVQLPTATLSATEVPSMLTPNGPWLVYLHYGLTIINQDGTGHTITERIGDFPVCDFDARTDIQENLSNRLVIFQRTIYLVQPGPTWTPIYKEWPTCYTDFTGNEKSGLLASIASTPNGTPELRIYELPSGKIRDHFPLMKCSEQCNTDNIGWWEIKWSPNGRYLAFPAVLDGSSSDLYVYDTENSSIRRLTSGPDDVGTIWWSPDGSQIIMGEIHENYYPYTSSLWTVSLSSGEIRLLYSRNENPYPQGLLGWLDDKRFIVYDGTTLADALDLPAYNLRAIDMHSGEITTLSNAGFMVAEFDRVHETVLLYASDTHDAQPGSGYEGPGIYLVSISNPQIRHLNDVQSTPTWNADLALFATDDPCENDPAGKKAFDYRGEWKCVHPGMKPESLSSPDGIWQVILKDGFWLKTNNQEALQVSKETPTQIIWRTDSGGVFFVAKQILYYTPLPSLNIKIVDKYPGGDSINYQWVGGE